MEGKNIRSFPIEKKLEAIAYAKSNSNEKAAKRFQVCTKTIRDWKKTESKLVCTLTLKGKNRHRVEGSGKKVTSQEMEDALTEWILSTRESGNRVSRNMIRAKALSYYPNCNDHKDQEFVASGGWVDRFMKRNQFSLRRQTTICQKDPDQVCEKIASYIAYASKLLANHSIEPANIIAMDETSVSFDQVASTTVDTVGVKEVAIKTTGHEKDRFTVIFAAKGDGTKLPPYIIFKEAKREVKKLQVSVSRAIIATHPKGVIDDILTKDWLNRVVGRLHIAKPRLLAWDSARPYISVSTKDHLKKFNIKTAVIPGGCTKYLQAPDVCWNRPFKDRLVELFSEWMLKDGKPVTKGGNLRACDCPKLVEWVKDAWYRISADVIVDSFKTCALTIDPLGSEDHKIHSIKMGQPCRDAWSMLVNYRDEELGQPIMMVDEAEEPEERIIDVSDDEENSDSEDGNMEESVLTDSD